MTRLPADHEREEADALLKAPGQERVESSLREAWSTPARSAARPWIRRLAVLGAAAAVAVYVGWRFAERSQDGGPSGNYLADRTVEVIHPTERAVAWDRIEWSGPAQATYRLRVRNAVDGEVILGPVEVRITVQDGQTNVLFGAAHADTREALEQAMPRLRELLASNGLSLGNTGVFQQAPREQGRPSALAAGRAETLTRDEAPVNTVTRRGLGLVDLYA